jgi:hypothetical protein
MIRKRVSAAVQRISNTLNAEDVDELRFSGGLTAPQLLKASYQHQGSVMKLRGSILYSMLPRSLQHLIQRISWLSMLLSPTWERRHLILLGSYLYKFKDSSNPTKGPKGSPISLVSLSINIVSQRAVQDDIGVLYLPNGFETIICVSTVRKRQYYAVKSREEAAEWIHTLQSARQEAITRSMGHAPADSYPKSWDYYDNLGASFSSKKERIRTKMEVRNTREMEMSSIHDGGPIPSGYYG